MRLRGSASLLAVTVGFAAGCRTMAEAPSAKSVRVDSMQPLRTFPIAASLAVEERAADLDAPLSDHLPDTGVGAEAPTRQIFSHQSGPELHRSN